ncbi:hypothetical protein [Bifidobacterium moukalabense]|uniref:hypothetical protein n=1 Tax=Bifidobacterium moukalabense TaxID=1333651 RepID=UPI0010F68055|nr:hypothetical protein [Bifidobacterium moukalabense]
MRKERVGIRDGESDEDFIRRCREGDEHARYRKVASYKQYKRRHKDDETWQRHQEYQREYNAQYRERNRETLNRKCRERVDAMRNEGGRRYEEYCRKNRESQKRYMERLKESDPERVNARNRAIWQRQKARLHWMKEHDPEAYREYRIKETNRARERRRRKREQENG